MIPHEHCIDRLQSLIGCACIGDCLIEGRGTLSTKPELKKRTNVTIDELDEFLDNFEVVANRDILYRDRIAQKLLIKYYILKR